MLFSSLKATAGSEMVGEKRRLKISLQMRD